jgi:hypothetical protein
MLKLFILLALGTIVFLQTAPAYCGVSKTATFQLSVTIPEHIIFNSNLAAATPFSNNPYQLIQTQIVMRNNRNINLTSIVVP